MPISFRAQIVLCPVPQQPHPKPGHGRGTGLHRADGKVPVLGILHSCFGLAGTRNKLGNYFWSSEELRGREEPGVQSRDRRSSVGFNLGFGAPGKAPQPDAAPAVAWREGQCWGLQLQWAAVTSLL